MMKQLMILTMVLFAVAACDSNPYSSGGLKVAPGEAKPGGGDDNQTAKVYMLDVPVSVNCTEGYTCSFNLRASVDGEQPVVTFENMPLEAYYNPTSGLVNWTPPVLGSGTRVQVVVVNLRGESDTVIGLTKTVVFIVNNRP